MKMYSRVQKIYRKTKRPAKFRNCTEWGRLEANIMEPKLDPIWSGRFLNDVAYSNSDKKVWFRFELTKMKLRRPVNFRKCIRWVDFEQTSWNTNSKLFEAALCWTMSLTELKNKNEDLYSSSKKYRESKRPAKFKDCIKWGWLKANIMEHKLEAIWSDRFLNDVAYSN